VICKSAENRTECAIFKDIGGFLPVPPALKKEVVGGDNCIETLWASGSKRCKPEQSRVVSFGGLNPHCNRGRNISIISIVRKGVNKTYEKGTEEYKRKDEEGA